MRFDDDGAASVIFAYRSVLSDGLPAAVVHRICREAQAFNIRNGLTGFLEIDGRDVHQRIEGDWSVVMPLAARILTDPRHGAIAIEAFEPIAAHEHGAWQWRAACCEPAGGQDLTEGEGLCLLPFVRRRTATPALPAALDAATTAS